MKAKYWILAGLLAFIVATPAMAQKAVVVTVPFDFFVGTTVMPAGEYRCVVDQPFMGTLTLRNTADPSATVMVLTQGIGQTPETNKLVFLRDGDRYVLHHVWMDTLDHGHDLLHNADVAEL
jgi:hypothetical protein